MKQKEPDQRLVWMAPTIFVVIILIIMIFGQEGDGWFGRVKEFQTLITGVLAILAAYITIGQMRQSDENADNRHHQLLKVSVRREIAMENFLRLSIEAFSLKRLKIEAIANDVQRELTDFEYADFWTYITNTIEDGKLSEASEYVFDQNAAVLINGLVNQYKNTVVGDVGKFENFNVKGRFIMYEDAYELADTTLKILDYFENKSPGNKLNEQTDTF